MASSNRHWPSMFKSKPCNPWQHDIISTACHRTTPYSSSSSGGCEERSPEPKPRWNPKPEQIRILEAIFNSGMVNPPRDEIRKIRAQLQEYGQVGDANVFYWFQNRKSRSKHKLRNLKNNNNLLQTTPPNMIPQPQITTPPSSSSSSSDKSPTSNKELLLATNKAFSIGFSSDVGPNSPTASVNQTFFQNETTPSTPTVVVQQQPDHQGFFFPVHHNGTSAITQGFCFSELSNMVQPHHQDHNNNNNNNVGPCTSLLLSEMMNQNQHDGGVTKKEQEAAEKAMKTVLHHHQHQHLSFCVTSPSNNNTSMSPNTTIVPSNVITTTTTTTNVTVPSPIAQIQGAAKCTVFINDVAFEVGVGPFNVREAFGDDVVLVHASGHPVLTNDWGITLHSLHHGAFYYLI